MSSTLVIKVGTGVLTSAKTATLNGSAFVRIVTTIAQLIAQKHQIILVSSGAVGAGVSSLNLNEYPSDIVAKQGCAAIGQSHLMRIYDELFSMFKLNSAQILLTKEDFKKRSHHVANTLNWILAHKNIVPIINENDSVSADELKFGDNDSLSVSVAKLIRASKIVFLTSVDGLYPSQNQEGTILRKVENIQLAKQFANSKTGKFSLGGMQSKLNAIETALEAGITAIIANGHFPERIPALLANEPDAIGTTFFPPM